jgi:outer membrane receptor for ferrienterochelin and colicin
VTVDVALEGAPATLGGVVVSASRRVEKITDAPATVTSIGTDVLDNTVGNTYAVALKEAKGLDFIQTGMTTVAINARGFNSSFNNRFLMVEDGRIAVLPRTGCPSDSSRRRRRWTSPAWRCWSVPAPRSTARTPRAACWRCAPRTRVSSRARRSR